MRYAYPVELAVDEDRHIVASFPDVPEALTEGANRTEARDALAAALAGYVHDKRDIPKPSPAKGRRVIPPPPLVAAKLALYQAMRRQAVSNSELARSLRVTEAAVRRLVDPDHSSRMDRVEAALTALGVDLVIEDAA